MLSRFFQRRMIWFPTPMGWIALGTLFCTPVLLWWFQGEAFLSQTKRLPANVLVVEAWIGREGVHAAKAEFDRGGYDYIVTTGTPTENRWGKQQWNYAEYTGRELLTLGIPADKVILAQPRDSRNQRTFESAVAAQSALQAKNLHPSAINVLTIGAHARRSRLIFAKVFGPQARVGVVTFIPAAHQQGPWWKSSDRAEDLIKETVGWLFEVVLNSGRLSNSPQQKP